jgi:hypothetical protein
MQVGAVGIAYLPDVTPVWRDSSGTGGCAHYLYD